MERSQPPTQIVRIFKDYAFHREASSEEGTVDNDVKAKVEGLNFGGTVEARNAGQDIKKENDLDNGKLPYQNFIDVDTVSDAKIKVNLFIRVLALDTDTVGKRKGNIPIYKIN